MSTRKHKVNTDNNQPLAIIGIGCRFPRADSIQSYWSNIRDGVDAITEVPATHWSTDDYFNPDSAAPDMTYARRGGFIDPVDFDPLLYGMSPNNIEATDTTQLLGMVVAREALLDAGYATGRDSGNGRPFDRDRTSVILGVTGTLELVIPLGARLGHPIWRRALKEAGVADAVAEDVVRRIAAGYVPWQENSFPGLLGNVTAGRIANRFDLGGTNCVVDAACASSLSAVHMAAMELYAGRSDMAITGGLDTFNDIFMYMCFSKTPALSPTGDSRPFHYNGDGTILGEGLGVVVLKRLADARRDGDHIYAVIRGIGSSSDGRGNAIYAPSAKGQQKALRNAYANAGVAPGSIELVEAHGTGTRVGDAVEAEALSSVFREDRPEGTWCAIGSVKSMIGHTKAAAGIAGLIKCALALQHKVLPPTLKVERPLDTLAPGQAPVYVNTIKRPWMSRSGHPRRAAVSAFGFGGSNFHAVLEEAGPGSGIDQDGRVLIYACSGAAVHDLQSGLEHIETHSGWNSLRKAAAESLRDYDGGQHYRLLLVIDKTRTDLAALLEGTRSRLAAAPDTQFWATPEGAFFGSGPAAGSLAWLFPGQGAQYPGMLRDLTCQYPQLRQTLDLADQTLGMDASGMRLSDYIYPIPVFDAQQTAAGALALRATANAQPAIGAVSAGVAAILGYFGVKAHAAAGHSFGELTALMSAGVYDEASLYRLARRRGELMQQGEGDRGAMLAVSTTPEDLYALIDEQHLDLIIANHNAPSQLVLSGASAEIERAALILRDRGIHNTRLPVAAAFHSSFVAGAEKPFEEFIRGTDFGPASFPVYANTTAAPYPRDADRSRALLAGQLAQPVEFVRQIENMYDDGVRCFIEAGPGNILTGLAGSILGDREHHIMAVDASRGKRNGQLDLAMVLAHVSALGHPCLLNKWDQTYLEQLREEQKPALTIPLSGANYVMPKEQLQVTSHKSQGIESRATSPEPQKEQLQATSHKPPATSHQPRIPGGQFPSKPGDIDATLQATQQTEHEPPATSPEPRITGDQSPSKPCDIDAALQATQQGILALQKLQEQTAQLHKQYLEGQEQAQRSIQQLILQQQQQLSGVQFPTLPTPITEQAPFPPTPTQLAAENASTTDTADVHPPETPDQASHPSPLIPDTQYSNILLEVVAEKTGYPMDMLSLEMSLDTDLGIDSIKRVEILSALQERLPGMQQIQPEELGTFQLLQHIVEYLAGGDNLTSASGPAPVSAGDGQLRHTLLEVVAEKTGYPMDMLSLEMSLDTDLGIDSIKRVEILSALQERLPRAPVPEPEQLAQLQTLQQIADYLQGGDMSTGAGVPEHAAGGDDDVLRGTLLEVVAEKTGYPMDMLNLEMSLDTDLGIDSIKRVEILSALQERLPRAPVPDPEQLAQLQTLQQIADYLRGEGLKTDDGPGHEPAIRTVPAAGKPQPAVDIARYTVTLPSLAAARPDISLPEQANLAILDDGSGLAGSLCHALGLRGIDARVIPPGNMDDPRSVGLVILAPEQADSLFVESAFSQIRGQGPRLRLLAGITRMGGSFGLQGDADFNPFGAGLAGLIKSADKEWPETRCKLIDIPAGTITPAQVERITDELLTARPLETGIDAHGARTPVLVREAQDHQGNDPAVAGEVVVISGGARGVTAEAAVALARDFRANLLLLGRSSAPEMEPDWLRRLNDEATIKRTIAARHTSQPLDPRALEQEYQRISANREILTNIRRMQETGVEVRYASVDIRDAAAVREAVAAARNVIGPITGFIHGAGVLADRLIVDKTAAQFREVFSTKVDGLDALLRATAEDRLKFMVLFSSTSARLGRKGQADYAAANEVLNKTAQLQRRLRPECRVLSINWGPWDGGMVSSGLKQLFASEGVGVIPLQSGATWLMREILGSGAVEVVATASEIPEAPCPRVAPEADLVQAFERTLALEGFPVLASHVINGRAVLPLAVIAEWLAIGAMHDNPGLMYLGFDELRTLKGVTLGPGTALPLQVMAGNMVSDDQHHYVPVELRSGTVPYARGRILLGDDYSQPPATTRNPVTGIYPHENVYGGGRLFHGPLLQGITRVDACSAAGIRAIVRCAPAPSEWVEQPVRSTWLGDPLVMDCAFQLMILWSLENSGTASLPTSVGKYRQYQRSYHGETVAVDISIKEISGNSVTANISFSDTGGRLLAEIEGCECVTDALLNEAFKRNRLRVPTVP